MSTQKLNIGLFGFGCVGQGLYHVLQNSKGFTANITKIAVKDKSKKRSLPNELFTFDKYEILNNNSINVVVELIDDAEEAFQIVKAALQNKKHVVTANKKMLATHLEELLKLKEENGVSLLYEASSCGSIPIIRTLEEYYDNELIHSVSGIFNGTTNYILTKTISENLTYTQALQQAQEKGFAESNPTSDVEGFDAKYKAIIIALHAFGIIAKPSEILNIGITALAADDIRYAAEKKYKIKLVPTIKRFETGEVSIFVIPKFIQQTNPLFYVDNEFNGVLVDGDFSGEQFLKGRGAGGNPTGAAVLSDISALSFGYQYEFKKLNQTDKNRLTSAIKFKAYLRYNSLLDLEKLNVVTIYEQYISETYKYVVAELSLEKVILVKEYIKANKLFIALVSDEIHLVDDSLNHIKKIMNAGCTLLTTAS
jgi:homoserine dehydrogenase